MNTKRGLSLLLAVVLVCAILPTGGLKVMAAENYDMVYYPVEEGSFYFDKLSGVLYGFEYNDSTQQVSLKIPQTIEGVEVRAIGTVGPDNGFWGDTNLEGIELPSTMTGIGPWAFKDAGITSITFPASITDIALAAFSGCEDLTLIRFLGDVPNIYEDAFEGVEATVVYPADNATWTADIMQDYGGTLTWVPHSDESDMYFELENPGPNLTWTIKDGTLTISGTGEMYNMTVGAPWYDRVNEIEAVVIEDGVTSIGFSAFADCRQLKSVTISDTVERIEGMAFLGCSNLESIVIPEGVTYIENGAFYGCWSICEITIPASVNKVGYWIFSRDCLALETVRFCGKAPAIEEETSDGDDMYVLTDHEIKVFYPAGDDSWTEDVKQKFGNQITWVAFTNYAVLDGENAVLPEDNDQPHSIRVAGAIEKFLNVFLNGQLVDSKNYTVTEGSTIVSFKPEYLETLPAGQYEVMINFTDGVAQTTLTIQEKQETSQPQQPAQPTTSVEPSNPKTGEDVSVVLPLVLLMILSMAGFAVTTIYKKRVCNR